MDDTISTLEWLSGALDEMIHGQRPNGIHPGRVDKLLCARRELDQAIQLLRQDPAQPASARSITAVLVHLADAGLFEGSRFSAATDGRPASVKPTAEIIEWASKQVNEAELAEELRQIQQTGGVELRDFIHELDAAAGHP